MTQRMFKIANEPRMDILTVNPPQPERLVAVIDKALAKDVADRFQSGEEMARAIRKCAAELGTVDLAL